MRVFCLQYRWTVECVEQMKVCTCLNPLQAGLAIFGCLLSYTSISKEMEDPLLRELAVQIGQEGMPVVGVHSGETGTKTGTSA